MKILLVEPDRLLAQTYAKTLRSAGHQVMVTSGAQAGIIATDHRRPDVILLEIQLVAHSGIEFLYELRSYAEWQAIPVLIHTQVPLTEFADSWPLLHDDLGVHEYLYKPTTSLADLLQAVALYAPQPA